MEVERFLRRVVVDALLQKTVIQGIRILGIRVGLARLQNHLQRGVRIIIDGPRFDERGAAVRLSRDLIGTPQRRRYAVH